MAAVLDPHERVGIAVDHERRRRYLAEAIRDVVRAARGELAQVGLHVHRVVLTPTVKVRRRVVERHFAGEIERLYA